MEATEPTSRARNWNIANILTLVRIGLAPVVLWLLLADGGAGGPLRWWAALLFILALATDGVDGAVARRYNVVTDLGKLLDPIADKIVISLALVGLSVLGELPWVVTILIAVREVGITVWRMVQLRRGVVLPAGRAGKVKTVAQAVAISLALLPLSFLLGPWNNIVDTVAMSFALILTVWSGVGYLWESLRSGGEGGRKNA